MSYRFNDAGIRAAFYEVVDEAPQGWVDMVAWRVPSNHGLEEYSLLGFPPAMREWVGNKQFKQVREDGIIIRNKAWEASIGVLKEELRRGETVQILTRIRELADRGVAHPGKMISDFMVANAESGAVTSYDGQNFFDTDHALGSSGTFDNDLTGAAATGTTPTVAEARDAIMATIQAILGARDDQGEPMNENARNFIVMVPALYWGAHVAAVTLNTIDNGVTNILANLNGFNVQLVMNARLSYTTKFVTFRTDGRVKPFILQEEVPLDLEQLTEGSDVAFLNRDHLYSAVWWGNCHFGMYQQACMYTYT